MIFHYIKFIIKNKMGNNVNKNYLQYKEVKKESNQNLGPVSQVVTLHDGQNYFMKVFNFTNQIQFQEKLNCLTKRKYLSSSPLTFNLLNIVQIQSHRSSEICNQNYSISVFMEYSENDLRSAFAERLENHKPFSESEILYLLKGIINALACAYSNGLSIPRLSTKSVFLNNLKEPKLVTSQLSDRKHPYFSFLSGPSYSDCYLAPELLKELINNCKDPSISPKTDIFSVGVMILQLCCKKSLEEYFDYRKMIFFDKKIVQQIQNIPYSKGLQELIRGMIEPRQNLRFGLANLQQIINSQLQPKPKYRIRRNLNPLQSKSRINIDISNIQLQFIQQNSLHQSNSKSNHSSCSIRQPLSNVDTNKNNQNINRKVRHSISLKPQYSSVAVRRNSEKIKNIKKKQFENGAVYDGEMDIKGRFQGFGTLFYPNGQICYHGYWKANKFHGKGSLYNSSRQVKKEILINYQDFAMNKSQSIWIQYQGQFNLDKKDGFGSLLFINGDKFSGEFSEDIIDGPGIYHKRNGTFVKGIWKNNQLIKF